MSNVVSFPHSTKANNLRAKLISKELKLLDLSTEEKALVKSVLTTDISDDDITEMRNTIEYSLREFESMSAYDKRVLVETLAHYAISCMIFSKQVLDIRKIIDND